MTVGSSAVTIDYIGWQAIHQSQIEQSIHCTLYLKGLIVPALNIRATVVHILEYETVGDTKAHLEADIVGKKFL